MAPPAFTTRNRPAGGDGGIRTHDRVTPIHTFQACAFDHSATSPHPIREATPLAAPLRFRKGKGFAIACSMKRYLTLAASAAIFAALPLSAQEAKTYPAPGEIVAAAKAEEWVAITPSELLVMDLAADATGKNRRVVIQLMPAPFSQGWIGNIRKLAAAKWWDGTSINRVQDNYVVQWGDATEKKVLPDGLAVVPESKYHTKVDSKGIVSFPIIQPDRYSQYVGYSHGWPVGHDRTIANMWPIHCYGMVGVGRNLSPDTGSGAELYTVIGHAPRHLDRNIALVGRVIEGIEHLSSLPRGTGALGFYDNEEERVPITSVQLGNEAKDMPTFEYLSNGPSFFNYAYARANRRDPFFIKPAGGADICNIPVPVRRKAK
jgi:cyclophilin family peptidyl-prolyl cis-trans isomerase